MQITSAFTALGGVGKVAVVAAAAAAVVGVWGIGPVVSAAITPGLPGETAPAGEAEAEKARESMLAGYQKMIDGRSPFVTPEPPRVEAPDESEPVIPTQYEGPPLVGFLGETAIFAPAGGEGVFLKPGMSGQGVRLVSIEAPWTVHVEYRGGQYAVNLFDEVHFGGSGGFGGESGGEEGNIFGGPPVPGGTRRGVAMPGRGNRGGREEMFNRLPAEFQERLRKRMEEGRQMTAPDGAVFFDFGNGATGEVSIPQIVTSGDSSGGTKKD